jgi:methylase of polypeptide subunit release factors
VQVTERKIELFFKCKGWHETLSAESIFEKLFSLEAGNFWFRARNKLIVWAIQKHFGNVRSFLEIGCGTGYVLSGIKGNLPTTKIYGSELHSRGLQFAAERLPDVELLQMDARSIPFVDEFDLLGAFDVLESIEVCASLVLRVLV